MKFLSYQKTAHLFLLLSLVSPQLSAEYRVFELNIVDKNTDKSRTVRSTLDNIQYREYYHVKPSEKVEYKTSWMCLGKTSNYKSYCKNPKENEEGNPNIQKNLN